MLCKRKASPVLHLTCHFCLQFPDQSEKDMEEVMRLQEEIDELLINQKPRGIWASYASMYGFIWLEERCYIFQNNFNNLAPSYKMELDYWNCFLQDGARLLELFFTRWS